MAIHATPKQQFTDTPDRLRALDLCQQFSDAAGGHATLSPTKFVEMMGIDLESFARDVNVDLDTITRSPAAESIQSHIRTTLQVLAVAMDASEGDLQAAIFWYRNEPLPVFDHKTAETLVAEGRAADVLELLASYQAGFVG
jgi:hypothetical protein